MNAKHMAWHSYPKQAIMSRNKMEKIMNRDNGEYKVLTWKAASQRKARLTPSFVFCFLQEILYPQVIHPQTSFFSRSSNFPSNPPSTSLAHFSSFLPLPCFCLLSQATTRSTAPCSERMSSPSTTTMVSNALCHMSMQLVLGRKGSPTPLRCGQLFPGVREKTFQRYKSNK